MTRRGRLTAGRYRLLRALLASTGLLRASSLWRVSSASDHFDTEPLLLPLSIQYFKSLTTFYRVEHS